jgi:hypothetical protein
VGETSPLIFRREFMNIKQGLKVSAIIDKLGLKITNAKGTQEEIGADLIIQVISKAYKADKEIISFVADMKKISIKEAEEVNLVEFIKEIGEIDGLKDFFQSAVK